MMLGVSATVSEPGHQRLLWHVSLRHVRDSSGAQRGNCKGPIPSQILHYEFISVSVVITADMAPGSRFLSA